MTGLVQPFEPLSGAEEVKLGQEDHHLEPDRERVLDCLHRSAERRVREQHATTSRGRSHRKEVTHVGIGTTAIDDIAAVIPLARMKRTRLPRPANGSAMLVTPAFESP